MTYKWIGAVLIVTACGGFGFSLAAAHRREVLLLRRFRRSLVFMVNELKYRLTPLPDLCRQAGREAGGVQRQIFFSLAGALDTQSLPDPAACMDLAVKNCTQTLPASMRRLLHRLGRSLGRFDLSGQIRGLEGLISACEDELALLNQNKDLRLRNYQTLGICAGLALVILFA